jgi:hypothetical protein
MAELELSWFVRRYELYAARVALQLSRVWFDSISASLAGELARRDQSRFAKREARTSGTSLVLGDDELAAGLRVEIELSGDLPSLEFAPLLGGTSSGFVSAKRVGDLWNVDRLLSDLPAGHVLGELTLAVWCPQARDPASANQAIGVGLTATFLPSDTQDASEAPACDADPSSVPLFDASIRWVGVEDGPDLASKIMLRRAEVRLGTDRVLAGTKLRADIIAPPASRGALRLQTFVRTGSAGETLVAAKPIEIPGDGDRRAGSLDVEAPAAAGSYRLELYNATREQSLASALFEVVEQGESALRVEIASSPTPLERNEREALRPLLIDIEERDWFAGEPRKKGLGLVLFLFRDAADRLGAEHYVEVLDAVSGQTLPVSFGSRMGGCSWTHLPPGRYRARAYQNWPEIPHPEFPVHTGTVTPVEIGGAEVFGRVRIAAASPQGEALGVRVWFYEPSVPGRHVAYSDGRGDSVNDLPRGVYSAEVRLTTAPLPVRLTNLAVEPGQTLSVSISGFGRLRADPGKVPPGVWAYISSPEGQQVAAIDLQSAIPVDLPPGRYLVEVERAIRTIDLVAGRTIVLPLTD